MSKAKAINVFFDTEFTKFRTMSDEPKLISIGCVRPINVSSTPNYPILMLCRIAAGS